MTGLWIPTLAAAKAAPTAAEQQLNLIRQAAGSSTFVAVLMTLAMSILALVALGVYLASLWPRRARRIELAMRLHPVGAVLLGTINLFFLVVITLLMSAHPATAEAAAIPLIACVLVLLGGLVAKGLDVGDRVLTAAGVNTRGPLSMAVGEPIVLLLTIVPLVGWLAGVYFAASGLGGIVLSFFTADDMPSPNVNVVNS